MRRQDREVTNIGEILKIIESCKVMRLGMSADNLPYVVPLNFGFTYLDGEFTFCFHCAGQGKKLDLLRQNPKVCFEMDCGHRLTEAETACAYGYDFRSVIGMGVACIVTDREEKKRLLACLMRCQTGKEFAFEDSQADAVTVYEIKEVRLTAKARDTA